MVSSHYPLNWFLNRYPSLLIFFIIVTAVLSQSQSSGAGEVTLTWDPHPNSTQTGFNVYYGTQSGLYDSVIDVGNVNTYTITHLEEGRTYFFALKSYNKYFNESEFSEEISFTIGEGDESTPGYNPEEESPITADAGEDQEIFSPIVLNGFATGGTANYTYSWSVLSGPNVSLDQFSTNSAPDPLFTPKSPGTYVLYFIVKDGVNPPANDTITITVRPTMTLMEAESGILFPPMTIKLDETAQDGKYVWVADDQGGGEEGYAEYDFTVPLTGYYQVWGREISNDGLSNSFYVSVDGGEEVVWNTTMGGYNTWVWDPVSEGDELGGNIEPVRFLLTEGEHTLRVKQREAGTKLDRLLITNDLIYTPDDEALDPSASPDSDDSELMPPINITPLVADAGEDLQIAGKVPVPLNGHATGGDGTYTYSWFILSGPDKNLNQFSNKFIANPIFTPNAEGTYELYFTVNDEVHSPISDTVTIEILPVPAMVSVELDGKPSEVLWLEAEAGVLHAPMREEPDAIAGAFIWVPQGEGGLENGYVEYAFSVKQAGTYTIWGREISNWGNSNSFYVSMDGGQEIVWNTKLGGYETWVWDQVNQVPEGADNSNPVIFTLDAGVHSFVVKQREDGTKLDKILITNNIEYDPSGASSEEETSEGESQSTPTPVPTEPQLESTSTPTPTPTVTPAPEETGTPTPIPALQIAQWDFDGDLSSSTGAAPLEIGAINPPAVPDFSFSEQMINVTSAGMVRYEQGTYFRMIHGLQPNGGGTRINQYTLIMDISIDALGMAGLWQTDPTNADDADWFIRADGAIGAAGNFGGQMTAGQWHRVVLAVDAAAGVMHSYIDGGLVQINTSGIELDGRWSLGPEVLLMADNDNQTIGGYINSVQLRNKTLNYAQAAALGHANAAGIPME